MLRARLDRSYDRAEERLFPRFSDSSISVEKWFVGSADAVFDLRSRVSVTLRPLSAVLQPIFRRKDRSGLVFEDFVTILKLTTLQDAFAPTRRRLYYAC